MNENRLRYIQRYYDGDVKRYEYETAEVDRHAVSWRTLQTFNECNEKQRKYVRNVAFWRLGFHASDSVMMPIAPYLCELADDYLNPNKPSWKSFCECFDKALKWVRNEHLFRNGWLDNLDLTEKDIKHYQGFMPHLAVPARKLLIEFIGYDPDLKHTLYPELTIRSTLSKVPFDQLHLHSQIELRHQTITVIKYLETIDREGRKAADELPHFGFNWTTDIERDAVH